MPELEVVSDDGGTLTARQTEVMAYAAQGLTGVETGRAMGLTPATVKTHRGDALRRLHAKSLAHGVAIWMRDNETDPRVIAYPRLVATLQLVLAGTYREAGDASPHDPRTCESPSCAAARELLHELGASI